MNSQPKPASVKLHSAMLSSPCFGLRWGGFQPCRTSHGRIGKRSGEWVKGWIDWEDMFDTGSEASAIGTRNSTISEDVSQIDLSATNRISVPLS